MAVSGYPILEFPTVGFSTSQQTSHTHLNQFSSYCTVHWFRHLEEGNQPLTEVTCRRITPCMDRSIIYLQASKSIRK